MSSRSFHRWPSVKSFIDGLICHRTWLMIPIVIIRSGFEDISKMLLLAVETVPPHFHTLAQHNHNVTVTTIQHCCVIVDAYMCGECIKTEDAYTKTCLKSYATNCSITVCMRQRMTTIFRYTRCVYSFGIDLNTIFHANSKTHTMQNTNVTQMV